MLMFILPFLLVLIDTSFVSAKKPEYEPQGVSLYHTPVLHSDELAHILNDSMPYNVFINFFAPWCKKCKEMEEYWTELSQEFDYIEGVRIVSIDCTGSGERACIKHNVKSYPHIKEIYQRSEHGLESGSLVEKGETPYWGKKTYIDLKRWIVTQADSLKISVVENVTPSKNENIADDKTRTSFDESKRSYFIRPAMNSSDGSIWCSAWRGSKFCDPEADKDPSRDLSCYQPVAGNRAGYCDCGNGRITKLSGCGHEHRKAFNCFDVCNPVVMGGCIDWKATKDCYSASKIDPVVAREQGLFSPKPPVRHNQGDKSCRDIISSDWSGYCDCGDNIELHFNCSHAPFTCETKCTEYQELKRKEEIERQKAKKEKRLKRINDMKEAQTISIEEEEAVEKRKQEILQYQREAQLKIEKDAIKAQQELEEEAKAAVQKETEKMNQDYSQHEGKMKNASDALEQAKAKSLNKKKQEEKEEHERLAAQKKQEEEEAAQKKKQEEKEEHERLAAAQKKQEEEETAQKKKQLEKEEHERLAAAQKKQEEEEAAQKKKQLEKEEHERLAAQKKKQEEEEAAQKKKSTEILVGITEEELDLL